jgi:uncharacterized membrane protein
LVIALTSSCGGGDRAGDGAGDSAAVAAATPQRGPAAPTIHSGILRLEGSGFRFVACGVSSDGFPLEDGTRGEAVTILQELGPDGVTALVEINDNRLVSLHYAAPEGLACDQLPPAVEVEARGQEPFWYVSVSGEVATVKTPEELDGVEYGDGQWTIVDNSHWRYEAAREGEPLVLELARERCMDTMSGARYPLRAMLTRHGIAMHGCALEGSGAQ